MTGEQRDSAAAQGLAAVEPREPAEEATPAGGESGESGGESGQPGESVEGTLRLLDESWSHFRALAVAYPIERLDERIGAGWTRKQLLAHVAAWHDSAAERLLDYAKSGQPQTLSGTADGRNAQTARAAMGRTSGEILHSLDASFGRLRRVIAQLDDEQLQAQGGWAGALIVGASHEHYLEHAPEMELPADLRSTGGRR